MYFLGLLVGWLLCRTFGNCRHCGKGHFDDPD